MWSWGVNISWTAVKYTSVKIVKYFQIKKWLSFSETCLLRLIRNYMGTNSDIMRNISSRQSGSMWTRVRPVETTVLKYIRVCFLLPTYPGFVFVLGQGQRLIRKKWNYFSTKTSYKVMFPADRWRWIRTRCRTLFVPFKFSHKREVCFDFKMVHFCFHCPPPWPPLLRGSVMCHLSPHKNHRQHQTRIYKGRRLWTEEAEPLGWCYIKDVCEAYEPH